MKHRALIICNGRPPSRTLLRQLVRESEHIIAADGGANVARRYGVRPHVIVGDLDSIRPSTRRHFQRATILHVPRQDNTDLEKALDFVVGEKWSSVVIIGATGKRLDFTLGNLSVMWNYAHRINISFAGDGWTAMPVGRERKVAARPGTTVSLIPFEACSGVTLRGLHYPLTNARMRVGQIGVSNVVRASPFTVRVRRGRMLMVILDDVTPAGRRVW